MAWPHRTILVGRGAGQHQCTLISDFTNFALDLLLIFRNTRRVAGYNSSAGWRQP